MPSNVAVTIELTDDERAQVEACSRRPSSAQALAARSRIVLLAAEGLMGVPVGVPPYATVSERDE